MKRSRKPIPPRLAVKPRYILLAALLVFAALLLKNAWLSDDAYITFRTIDNFVSGYGPVHNVGERVQSYTHPLWMLCLSTLYLMTRELYFTTIILSLLLTLATLIVFFKLSAPRAAVLGLAVLFVSKAFVDYSSSGLENPLSHLLLALFLYRYFRGRQGEAHVRYLAILACLAALNRLDTLLVCLPALGFASWQHGWKRSLAPLAQGFVPLIAWTVFSLLYYGAPVANPVYSKLATGIPSLALARQGWHYFLNSLAADPVTLVAIAVGCAAGIIERRLRPASVVAGIVLYLFYVLRVGGDFMSGRFFTVPLLAAVMLLTRNANRLKKEHSVLAYVLIALMAVFSARGNLLSGPRYGDVPLVSTRFFGPLPLSLIDKYGISDERGFYYQATGLFRPNGGSVPDHHWVQQGLAAAHTGPPVQEFYTLGFVGYYAGPRVHIIDPNGLNDFLIARLPVPPESHWRIGHFTRTIPEGYTESVTVGRNVIRSPHLSRYYDVVRLITRGDILADGRLTAIWKLNTGQYDDLIENYVRESR